MSDTEQNGAPFIPTINQIVIGADTRVRVSPTTGMPYRLYGQLEMTFPNGETYTGTGTVIGGYYVLTAAHNLWGEDLGGWATSVSFFPARNATTAPYGEIAAAQWFVPEEYRTVAPPSPLNTPTGVVEDYTQYLYDFGLVRLSQPVNVGYAGMEAASNSYLSSAHVLIAGYPGDKLPEDSMWAAEGRVQPSSNDDDLIFYQIPTYQGESGAGLMVKEGNDFYVVGVHVAGDPDLNSNFAVWLNSDNIRTIRGWM